MREPISHPSQRAAPEDHIHKRAYLDSVDSLAIQAGAVGAAELGTDVYGLVGDLSTIDPDDAAAAGVSVRLARADHQHPFTSGVASALTKTATSAEGSSASHARADHAHATSALPWGLIGQFSSTANNGPHTGSVDTDMVLNNQSVISGHRYAFFLTTQAATSAVGSLWALDLEVNTVVVARLALVQNPPAVDFQTGVAWWTAPATQATDDFVVTAVELNPGGDLTLQAGATNPRTFTMVDMG